MAITAIHEVTARWLDHHMADPKSADSTAAAPAERRIAPIKDVPKTPVKAGAPPIPAERGGSGVRKEDEGNAPSRAGRGEDAPRNPDGTYKKDAPSDELPEELREGDSGLDPYDRATASLDGTPPESSVRIKTTRKVRAKDVLKADAAAPEGEGIVPAKEGEEPPPDDATVPLPEGEQPAEEAPEEEFVFANVKFRNREHAEANFTTLRNIYNAETKKRTKAETTARANYEAALSWKAKAEAYETGALPLPTRTGGASPGTPGGDNSTAPAGAAASVAAAAGVSEESVLKKLDWTKYREIRKEHDAEAAVLWAVGEMMNSLRTQYDGRLNEITRPGTEAKKLMESGAQVGEKLDEMAEWVFDGSSDPVYPELSDDDARDEIGKLIIRLNRERGWAWDYFKSNEGAHATILMWRDWRARNNRPWKGKAQTPGVPDASSNPPPPDPHASAVESVRRANAGAQGAGTLTGRNAPMRAAPAHPGRGAELVAAMTKKDDNEFGWGR